MEASLSLIEEMIKELILVIGKRSKFSLKYKMYILKLTEFRNRILYTGCC